MIIFGVDNGTTGSIGVIDTSTNESWMYHTPHFSEQDYTKKKQNVTRLDGKKFKELLEHHKGDHSPYECVVLLERPFTHPRRIKQTKNAARTLEAMLIVLELLDLPKRYVDSKEWQKVLLPYTASGPGLKTASKDIGIRLFPHLKEVIVKQKDADGILIAEYGRKQYIKE